MTKGVITFPQPRKQCVPVNTRIPQKTQDCIFYPDKHDLLQVFTDAAVFTYSNSSLFTSIFRITQLARQQSVSDVLTIKMGFAGEAGLG